MNEKLSSDSPAEKVCVVGLGYVGLPLATAMAGAYSVVGYDCDGGRVLDLQKGADSSGEVDAESLRRVRGNLRFADDIAAAADCTVYLITVPTPLADDNRPDLSALKKSCETVATVLNRGNMVVIESTVYPGVTEEFCAPLLAAKSGLVFNQDFVCGYSPERINPADPDHRGIADIVKITAGSTPAAATRTDDLYRRVIRAGTHRAPSIAVAEAAKAVENTQRDVNIALMNELAMLCDSLLLDSGEVFSAAKSKWNFLPFTPGLVGGHCIGVDPYYLTYKAKMSGYAPNLILAARQINDMMGNYIGEKTLRLMMRRGLTIKDAVVLIFGFAFKENCGDARNSRVFDLRRVLLEAGCKVVVCDPLVDNKKVFAEYGFECVADIGEALQCAPCAVIFAVAHRPFADINKNDFADALLVDVKNIIADPDWRL